MQSVDTEASFRIQHVLRYKPVIFKIGRRE